MGSQKSSFNNSSTAITKTSNTSLISKTSKSSKHSKLSSNSRTSLKRMRKSSFTIVNEKIKKGLKSTGGIKFKRNTGKANSLLSDFHQRKKVGVKSEEEKEAEKLERDAREKEEENLRLATLARMKELAAERERKMIEWAEQEHFRKLVEEKLGNRSFREKYLVYGVTKVCLLGIVMVLGSVLGMLIVYHQEVCVRECMRRALSCECIKPNVERQKVLLVLILCWSLGSIALIRHSYFKFKEFTDNNEQKQKAHYEQEIRNANPVV